MVSFKVYSVYIQWVYNLKPVDFKAFEAINVKHSNDAFRFWILPNGTIYLVYNPAYCSKSEFWYLEKFMSFVVNLSLSVIEKYDSGRSSSLSIYLFFI